MTIECYFRWCPRHSIHDDPEDGPFCYEGKCKATDIEIESYKKLRKEELAEYRKKALADGGIIVCKTQEELEELSKGLLKGERRSAVLMPENSQITKFQRRNKF